MADAMVIVVTGGNSFLARHLIPYLANNKTIVFATYRTLDERLEALQGIPKVQLVRLNVGEYAGRLSTTAARSGCFGCMSQRRRRPAPEELMTS